MDQSASEAVIIGVNVFIFIIALTASILLMTNVLNMVDFANENAVKGMSGTLANSIGVVKERLVYGSDLITYYRKIMSDTKKDDVEYFVKSTDIGREVSIENFVNKESFYTYSSKKFELVYKGTRYDADRSQNIYQYVFEMKED